jgi:hypothetical protein
VLPIPVIVAGLVAGASMAMIDMLFEAAAGGSVWGPATYLSALIIRPLQASSAPAPFLLDPFLLGLLMQLIASLFLSYLFALYIAPRIPSEAMVVAGAAYGAIVFLFTSTLLLPLVNPVMFRLNGVALAIAHLCWGAVLGRMLERSTDMGLRPKPR